MFVSFIHVYARTKEKLIKVVDAKLICKHKRLIPDSNVKACQPI